MDGLLSPDNHRSNWDSLVEVSQIATGERQKLSSDSLWKQNLLFPSLPDDISVQIIARLPRIYHFNAKLVSRRWKTVITSPELYRCRKRLGTTEEWLCILTKNEDDKLMWYSLDPISKKWQRLPLMPTTPVVDGPGRSLPGLCVWNMVGPSIVADAIRGDLGSSALDQVTFCGYAVGAVNGCLYVLGGFIRGAALRSVWRYDPTINSWSEASPMPTARAYCKTSVLNGKLYVVGGLNGDSDGLDPLQSAEVFDPNTGLWSDVPSMPFSKAQMPPAVYQSNLPKPVAMGMASYRGKLYVPQSLYSWPFFTDVGGEVYDPETKVWVEMPNGMGNGWPDVQPGNKSSVVVGGELYALDTLYARHSARIKVYVHQDDTWKAIAGDIPICDHLEFPFLLSGLLGKLHVITKDANHNILVMQAIRQTEPGPSQSASTVTSESFLQDFQFPVSRSEANMWKVVTSRSSASEELLSCQILDV